MALVVALGVVAAGYGCSASEPETPGSDWRNGSDDSDSGTGNTDDSEDAHGHPASYHLGLPVRSKVDFGAPFGKMAVSPYAEIIEAEFTEERTCVTKRPI